MTNDHMHDTKAAKALSNARAALNRATQLVTEANAASTALPPQLNTVALSVEAARDAIALYDAHMTRYIRLVSAEPKTMTIHTHSSNAERIFAIALMLADRYGYVTPTASYHLGNGTFTIKNVDQSYSASIEYLSKVSDMCDLSAWFGAYALHPSVDAAEVALMFRTLYPMARGDCQQKANALVQKANAAIVLEDAQ